MNNNAMDKFKRGQWQYTSLDELSHVVPAVLKSVRPGKILLEGPMGAGKTTFVQHAAAVLHITEPVLSPTYQLMNVYLSGQIAHLDLYRLKSGRELELLGIDDLDCDWYFIEWGLAYEHILQPLSALIEIEILNNNSRLITLYSYDTPTY